MAVPKIVEYITDQTTTGDLTPTLPTYDVDNNETLFAFWIVETNSVSNEYDPLPSGWVDHVTYGSIGSDVYVKLIYTSGNSAGNTFGVFGFVGNHGLFIFKLENVDNSALIIANDGDDGISSPITLPNLNSGGNDALFLACVAGDGSDVGPFTISNGGEWGRGYPNITGTTMSQPLTSGATGFYGEWFSSVLGQSQMGSVPDAPNITGALSDGTTYCNIAIKGIDDFINTRGVIKVEKFEVQSVAPIVLRNEVPSTGASFIRMTAPSDKSSAGPIGNVGNAAPDDMFVGLVLTSTTTMNIFAGGTGSTRFMGEIWRYEGKPNGRNEFIRRGSYIKSIPTFVTDVNQGVSGIVNEDKCVPFITGIESISTSVSEFDEHAFSAHMDGAGNVVISRGVTGSTSMTVYIDVVEFTGSNWSIGHAISSNHSLTGETVTINTDSTGAGGSTFDVGNWDNAFIEGNMEGDSAGNVAIEDNTILMSPHVDTDKVNFDVAETGSSANDGDAYAHVIVNPHINVYRGADDDFLELGDESVYLPWASGATTGQDPLFLALEFFAVTSGTGTAFGRGKINATIKCSESGMIRTYIHREGNTVKIKYGIIDLTNLTDRRVFY